MDREMDSLRADYTDFTFGPAPGPITQEPRYEAVRTRGDMTLWVLITRDADEMRQILDAALA